MGGRIAGGGGRIAGGGGRIAAGGGLFAGGGGLFAGGPFATGLIAGGPFASGLNAATQCNRFAKENAVRVTEAGKSTSSSLEKHF